MTNPVPIRALFLSDLHFGYKGVDCAAILDCLRHYAPQTIYLAGDIIDGWKLAKRWYWCEGYTDILDALGDHKRRGAKIIYLTGNHDEKVRQVNFLDRMRFADVAGIEIRNSCIHTAQDGRRIVVIHGDQFDSVFTGGRISRFGDWIMGVLTDFFDIVFPAPLVDIDGRQERFSLAKALVKKSGKLALRILRNMQRRALRMAKRKNADGLICGHSHVPKLKTLRRKYLFGNCGTWVGYTNTCIIETMDGTFELVRWPDMRRQDVTLTGAQAVARARHPETAMVIRAIRALWPVRRRLRAQRVQTQAL